VPHPLPRIIFFDLDGTLLASGAVLRRRSIAAVRAAHACGATIVLATGGFSARTRLIASLLTGSETPHVWSVAHNGAAIWDPVGTLAYCRPTPPAAVEAVMRAAGPRLWATFETADNGGATRAYYAGRLRPELVHLIWGPQPDPVAPEDGGGVSTGLEPRWDWRQARGAAQDPGSAVLGCWCIGTAGALRPLDRHSRGEQLDGARYLPWGKRLGQILGRPRMRLEGRDVGALEASKGSAAAWLCDRLGIPLSEAAAFGDSDNDLDLLARVGTPVAMANATAACRARARIIAPPNDEDGVAHVLEAWLARPGDAESRVRFEQPCLR
jgi:hydroxymethylpyrimidine pyrophosphatase-like HAD family hydrolase